MDPNTAGQSGNARTRRSLLRITGGVGMTALAGSALAQDGTRAQRDDDEQATGTCRPRGADASIPAWSVDAAAQIEQTDANTVPVIEEINEVAPGLHVWDTWPLRNRDGSVACIDGWSVQFALTAPDEVLPGKRHDIAEIRFFYSRDGQDWRLGGPVFVPGTAKGNRQWAASAVYDQETEEMFMFYTATGRDGNPNDPRGDDVDITYEQRLALAEGATVETTTSGVDIEGMWEHEIILTADGEYYQTQEQAGDGIIYAFRDPWYFEDPATGCQYLIFEGNSPIEEGQTDCEAQELDSGDYRSGVAATGAEFNGNVGIAVSTADDDMSEWELRPPLLEATCVNQQLERGNVVVANDRYYLFFDSHKFTFAAGLEGPDGMYGFVADSLHGEYEPLNDSGLVLANPPDEPFQTYSWMPVPYDDDKIAVISYFNYFGLGETSLTGVGDLSREEQQARFGGTFAPTAVVTLDGSTTELVETLGPGFLPSACSDPPLDQDSE